MSVITTSNQDILPPRNALVISKGAADMAPAPIDLTPFKGGHISIANASATLLVHVRFSTEASGDLADVTDWFVPPESNERYRLDLGSPIVSVSVFATAAAVYIIRVS